MIVEPDFPDHWKVRLLVTRLETEGAVACLLRLWAYCQQRRDDTFPFTPASLAAICRWQGGSGVFWDAMTDPESGFLVEGEVRAVPAGRSPCSTNGTGTAGVPRGTWWVVRQFRDVNATLFKNWTRNPSGKGKQQPAENPTVTPRGPHGVAQDVVRGGPQDPHGQPTGDPKGREGKGRDREEGTEGSSRARGPASGSGGIPAMDEVNDWRLKFNQGNPHGIEISVELAGKWFLDRQTIGWVTVRGGVPIPIVDWQSDLIDFTKWKLGGGGGGGATAKKENGPSFNKPPAAVITDERLPEPPCPWRTALDVLYPAADFPDLDRARPWGLFQPEIRREIECECRRQGVLSKDWRQGPVPGP